MHSANHQGTKADNNNKKDFFVFCLPFRTLFTLSLKVSYHRILFGNCTGFILWLPVSYCPVVKWIMSAWGEGTVIRPCSLPPPPRPPCLCVCTCGSLHSAVSLSVSGFALSLEGTHTSSFPPHYLIPFSLIFLSNLFLFLPFNQNDFFPFSPFL